LERIRGTYALVPGFERMLATVREHRLILLRGLPDTGLTTTAVRLLDEVTGGQVARLDLATGLGSIREKDLSKKRGYVIRLPSSSVAAQPNESQLDALAELLDKRECHCVVLDATGPGEQDELDGYAFDYEPPDWTDVLSRHIAWRLRPDDPEGTEQRRLMDLADDPGLLAALGPAPRPVNAVGLADLLVRHSRGRLSLIEVAARCAGMVLEQAATWFTVLRHPQSADGDERSDSLALAAFRIALAVLNISTYHQVAAAAAKLETHMTKVITAQVTTPRVSSVSLDQHSVLAMSRARTTPGIMTFGADAVVLGELVEYEDNRFPSAVLEHVWQEYHWLREAMVNWLIELGDDETAIIWVRAAQAAGVLSAIDFHYGFQKLIRERVVAETARQRRFAAIALDQASQDSRSRRAVLAFLKRWRRAGGDHARWTTAAALGYGLGLEDIDATLDALRILGTPDESRPALDDSTGTREMIVVVGRSLRQLLAFGAVEPVLLTLTDWLVHRRNSMRTLARSAVLELIRARGFHSSYLEVSGGRDYRSDRPEHERWPLLLALQHDSPRLTEPVVELLCRALRGRDGDRMTDRFRSWIRISENDSACLAALERFLPLLVRSADDAARLIHLIDRLRHQWAEPLRPDVAERLETALRSAIPLEVEPWTISTMS
jgi:hypothetical protein